MSSPFWFHVLSYIFNSTSCSTGYGSSLSTSLCLMLSMAQSGAMCSHTGREQLLHTLWCGTVSTLLLRVRATSWWGFTFGFWTTSSSTSFQDSRISFSHSYSPFRLWYCSDILLATCWYYGLQFSVIADGISPSSLPWPSSLFRLHISMFGSMFSLTILSLEPSILHTTSSLGVIGCSASGLFILHSSTWNLTGSATRSRAGVDGAANQLYSFIGGIITLAQSLDISRIQW